MKVIIKPKGWNPSKPWTDGINVVSIVRGPGWVEITGKRAKRGGKRRPRTPAELAFIRKRLREQGYEGTWGKPVKRQASKRTLKAKKRTSRKKH